MKKTDNMDVIGTIAMIVCMVIAFVYLVMRNS
jgi:hypothetical protein